MPLSDASVRSLKPTEKIRKVSDERGLYLELNPNGGKYWRFKYRFGGKEKRLALGVYPDVSLRDAREARDDARKMLARGVDPGEKKKAVRLANFAAADSFKAIAMEWYEQNVGDWSKNHHTRLLSMFQRCIFPLIGSRPISEIKAVDVLAVIRRIEKTSIDTAHRALTDCGRVFRYAIATQRADNDPTPALKGALRSRRGKHFSATTEPKRLGEILLAIDNYRGTPQIEAALKLAPLVFVRPGELRTAEWSDFDLDEALWQYTISKTDTPHMVPLATQAVAILADLKPFTGHGKKVFPSGRRGRSKDDDVKDERPMSDAAVNVAMRSMEIGQDEMTGHGFRAVARTLLDEVLKFRPDVIEHQLGHTVRDPNGRAYNRTTHLDERRVMMQAWADYLDKLKDDTRIRLRAGV